MTYMHDPAIGTFNMARSYQVAALLIQNQSYPLPCYLEDSPTRVLLAFSLELYLKAYLLQKDVPPNRVRKYGHKLAKIAKRCVQEGLDLPEGEAAEIRGIENTNVVIDDRYFSSGMRKIPNDVRMQALADQLCQTVGAELARRDGLTLTEQGISVAVR